MQGFAGRLRRSHILYMQKRTSPVLIASLMAVLITLASVAQAQIKVNFEKEIWPILEEKCVQCHKAPYEDNGRTRKPKAGLRLDAAWAITMGSDDGAVLKPSDSDHSSIYQRTILPEHDDDDFMPPTGKADPLTEDEKKVFAKWIDEGADFGGWAGNLEGKPKRVSNTGSKIPVSEIQEIYKKLSEGLEPLEEKAWKEVTASGGRVMPLAKTSPLLAVDFRLTAEDATDEKVQTITAIGSQLAHLDLSKTQVTDALISEIGKMDRLVKLDLHRTNISDAEMAELKNLKNLRYLNLYGTQVTDAGLKHLHGIKSLRSVFLWDSKATKKGAKALAQAIPEAKINIE